MKICVVGLGYVGLPLAALLSTKYKVIGYDISESRVSQLIDGVDITGELESDYLLSLTCNLKFSNSVEDAHESDVFIITVPTPIDEFNKPDLSPLISASEMVGSIIKRDNIVIFESTVYPGVTEEICAKVIENKSGLEYNKDFFCGYSPERINPGDKERSVDKIIKVTSGSTASTARIVDELYKSVITAGTYMAPNIKVAEAAKVIENTQRDVNIALVNELAMIFNEMDIDTTEVLKAASTKWNFINMRPGLVGGHCIGVDPYYLTYRAEQLGYTPNLILASRQINNGMTKFITENIIQIMVKENILINKSSILILGATFKENCSDLRNSKVENLVDDLGKYGIKVSVYDPLVCASSKPQWLKKYGVDSLNGDFDIIIGAVAHDQFNNIDLTPMRSPNRGGSPVVVDLKNMFVEADWRL
ncbi:Vi polysaccharide biosynthesis protein VipA/TviB [Aliidiomarina maris]|nr:Vi polysaccharide biosynthesis protein VipA/TviB [Aliidiomarina maris]